MWGLQSDNRGAKLLFRTPLYLLDPDSVSKGNVHSFERLGYINWEKDKRDCKTDEERQLLCLVCGWRLLQEWGKNGFPTKTERFQPCIRERGKVILQKRQFSRFRSKLSCDELRAVHRFIYHWISGKFEELHSMLLRLHKRVEQKIHCL